MTWISFTVPASHNDLFSDLIALSSRHKSLVRARHCEKGDRVLEIYLEPEGASAAQEIMAGQPIASIEPGPKTKRGEAALDYL